MVRHFAEHTAGPAALLVSFQRSRDGAPGAISCCVRFTRRRTKMTQRGIHFHRNTTLTPEQYIAGLTDFGPGRSKLFGNSADEYLKVHYRGRSQADVTEGSGGIWERLHYDWSNPDRVVLTTTDSNVWGGASGHTYLHASVQRHDRHRRGG